MTTASTSPRNPTAFHADPAVKAKYVGRMEAHMAADELIRGRGWDEDDLLDGFTYGIACGIGNNEGF